MWKYEYKELSTLMIASYFGLDDLAAIKIDRGSNSNERDAEGWTPLMYASWSGSTKVVTLLLDNGADLNAEGQSRFSILREDYNALTVASMNRHSQVVQLLLDHEARGGVVDSELALSLATANGHEATIDILLAHGFPLEEGNYHQQRPLYHACLNRKTNVCHQLVKRGADIFARDVYGRSTLDMAAEAGCEDVVK
jgi:ankyrin repeat protein